MYLEFSEEKSQIKCSDDFRTLYLICLKKIRGRKENIMSILKISYQNK